MRCSAWILSLFALGFGLLFLANKLGCCHKCNVTEDDVKKYGAECLANVIPPWPICVFHKRSAGEFVKHSKDSATRCCGSDTSECRCPHMDTWRFQGRIQQWCEAVKTCPAVDDEESTANHDASAQQELHFEEEEEKAAVVGKSLRN